MQKFKLINFNTKIVSEEEVSLNFIKLVEDFKKESARYNNGIPIPLYFDCSKNIKIKQLLSDCQKEGIRIETTNVSFPIDDSEGKRSFMIYLSHINPIQECIAAHEIIHGLLFTKGFKIIKHKKRDFDYFEGKVLSFVHHFPLHEIFKKYDLKYDEVYLAKCEEVITKNLKFLHQKGYDGSNKALNIGRTFQCLNFSYISSRAVRRRLERLMKLLPSEIYDKYKTMRQIVAKTPMSELMTSKGCMKLMTTILKVYEVENEFKKDFDGFNDYLSYEKLLGK